MSTSSVLRCWVLLALCSVAALGCVGEGPGCEGLTTLAELRVEADASRGELARQARCLERVDGELYLDWVSEEALVFERLRHVGSLRIQGGEGLKSVAFPALRSVGGDVSVQGMRALTTLSLPVLTDVDSTGGGGADPPNGIRIVDNRTLIAIELPEVTRLGRLAIERNPLLERVEAPLLETVVGTFTEACDVVQHGLALSRNAKLVALSLPQLREVEQGELRVEQASALEALELPSLEKVGAHFTVRSNPSLQAIDVPKLETAWRLWIQGNPQLPQAVVNELEAQLQTSCFGSTSCDHDDPCDANGPASADAGIQDHAGIQDDAGAG